MMRWHSKLVSLAVKDWVK